MTFSADFFQPHLNTAFFIQPHTGESIELKLTEIKQQPSNNSPFDSFSLFFNGPNETPLAQGSYALSHADLPEQVIFIVPVARQETGYRYQACFSTSK